MKRKSKGAIISSMKNHMKKKYVPNKLFAVPSFVGGMASVIDLGGILHKDYNSSKTECEADSKALQNDWRAVGDDINNSISNYEQKFCGATK